MVLHAQGLQPVKLNLPDSSKKKLHVAIDSSNIKERAFDKKQLEKLRSNKELNYTEEKPKVESPLGRLFNWIEDFISRRIFGNKAFPYVLYSILFVAIVFLIFKITQTRFRFMIYGNKQVNGGVDLIIADDTNKRNLDKAIADEITNGNFRLAVRFMYLKVLKNLSDSKMIDWNLNKTNFDYYLEIPTQEIKEPFRKVTMHYDYIWYGDFEVHPDSFAKIKTDYENMYSKLNVR